VVRLPLQGGLPPVDAAAGTVVEVACDESGFSGTNLLDPVTPVITHASVDLTVDEAAALVTALRSGFRFSPAEFKSGPFLRGPRAAEAREWFLTALHGRAHIHLVDKEFFLATRIVDLFLAEPSYAAGTRLARQHRPAALALYRSGLAAGAGWAAFLAAFVDLVRIKRRHRPDRRALERFFAARDALLGSGLAAPAEEVLARLAATRVWDVVTRLGRDPSIPPPLEPLVSALAETVLFWSAGRHRILVIHDEQSALTAGRLRRLQQVLAEAAPLPHPGTSPLVGLIMVDSRDDPRVQVADLLAGVARRSPPTTAEADPLRPFLSPTSLREPTS
jgi:hypothetical protein